MKKLLFIILAIISITLAWSLINPKDVPSNYNELIIGEWVVTNEKYVDCEDCWVDYTSEEWYTPEEWTIEKYSINKNGDTYIFKESQDRHRYLLVEDDFCVPYEMTIERITKKELEVCLKTTESGFEHWYKLRKKL